MNWTTGAKKFSPTLCIRQTLGPTQHPIQWVPGIFPPGVERSGSEADHSTPPSAKVKKAWSYTSIPPYFLMA